MKNCEYCGAVMGDEESYCSKCYRMTSKSPNSVSQGTNGIITGITNNNVDSEDLSEFIFCMHCGTKLSANTEICPSCGQTTGITVKKNTKFCVHCGKELLAEAVICPGCGCAAGQPIEREPIYMFRSPEPKTSTPIFRTAVEKKQEQETPRTPETDRARLDSLASRYKTYGIIWLIIGALQLIFGNMIYYELDSPVFMLFISIVAVVNIASGILDILLGNNIRTCMKDRRNMNIVNRVRPIVGPIITLVYNAIFGGGIGVVGSIYYLTSIRSYVLSNKDYFDKVDEIAQYGKAGKPQGGI